MTYDPKYHIWILQTVFNSSAGWHGGITGKLCGSDCSWGERGDEVTTSRTKMCKQDIVLLVSEVLERWRTMRVLLGRHCSKTVNIYT